MTRPAKRKGLKVAKVTHSQHTKEVDGFPHIDDPNCPCGPLQYQEGECLHFVHQSRWLPALEETNARQT